MSHGVFIFGSCVSRDTFTELPDQYNLIHYTARQSAISAGRPANGVAESIPRLSSKFQDRVVRADIKGNLLDIVRSRGKETDVVLMDLVDERFGVIEIGGGYVTRLHEFWSNGGKEVSRGAPHLTFGSDEHFSLWRVSAGTAISTFKQVGVSHIILLHTQWTDLLDTGDPLEAPSWMPDPEDMNSKLIRYVRHYASLGVQVVTLPLSLTRSTLNHRWGASPFHYTDEAHAWLAHQVQALVATATPE